MLEFNASDSYQIVGFLELSTVDIESHSIGSRVISSAGSVYSQQGHIPRCLTQSTWNGLQPESGKHS